jgi:ABC-type transport system involved in multi-copper enzyme maturation permease subunit
MKMNPILRQELRIKARSMNFTWMMAAYNLVLGVMAFLYLGEIASSSNLWGYDTFQKVLEMYRTIIVVEMTLLTFIIPSITGAAIAGEREKQTLDLLLASKLSHWKIICGKLETSAALMLILIISSFPILALAVIVGGIQPGDLIVVFLFLFCYTIFIGSIGIFFSTVFKKTTTATILTYITLLIFIVVIVFFVVVPVLVSTDLDGGSAIIDVTGYSRMDQIISKIAGLFARLSNNMLNEYWIWFAMIGQLFIAFLFSGASVLRLKYRR